MSEIKRPFLVVYDYGTGGLWGVVLARSGEEIRLSYPELDPVEQRPKWMSAGDYDTLASTPYDIDDAPWGLLNALLEDRHRR